MKNKIILTYKWESDWAFSLSFNKRPIWVINLFLREAVVYSKIAFFLSFP